MIGYIIYLPEYENSVAMAQRALQSAEKHGWEVRLYPGVNGLIDTLSNHNLRILSLIHI